MARSTLDACAFEWGKTAAKSFNDQIDRRFMFLKHTHTHTHKKTTTNKQFTPGGYIHVHVCDVLADLSRRLGGELIVYGGIRRRRPSSSVVRREHFQTTSPLKPLSRFFSYSHIASIGRGDE